VILPEFFQSLYSNQEKKEFSFELSKKNHYG